jgi:hypothetical protein
MTVAAVAGAKADTGAADKTTDTAAAAAAAAAAKTPDQIAAEAATAAAEAAKTGTKTAEQLETERKTAAAEAAAKPPAKYELALPDGSQEFLDKDDLAIVSDRAKTKGWTNDQAQEAVNELATGLRDQSAAFRAAAEADPEYGGENLLETQRFARLALEKIRPATHPRYAAITRILNKTGYGNHVEVLAMLADIGKLMAEDRPGLGNVHDGNSKKDPADVLYGSAKD